MPTPEDTTFNALKAVLQTRVDAVEACQRGLQDAEELKEVAATRFDASKEQLGRAEESGEPGEIGRARDRLERATRAMKLARKTWEEARADLAEARADVADVKMALAERSARARRPQSWPMLVGTAEPGADPWEDETMVVDREPRGVPPPDEEGR